MLTCEKQYNDGNIIIFVFQSKVQGLYSKGHHDESDKVKGQGDTNQNTAGVQPAYKVTTK